MKKFNYKKWVTENKHGKYPVISEQATPLPTCYFCQTSSASVPLPGGNPILHQTPSGSIGYGNSGYAWFEYNNGFGNPATGCQMNIDIGWGMTWINAGGGTTIDPTNPIVTTCTASAPPPPPPQNNTCADITYQGVDPTTCCDIPGNSGSPCVTIDGQVPDGSAIGTYFTFQYQNYPSQTLRITGVTPQTGTPNMDLPSDPGCNATGCAPQQSTGTGTVTGTGTGTGTTPINLGDPCEEYNTFGRQEQEELCERCTTDPVFAATEPMCKCCPERERGDDDRGRERGRGDLGEQRTNTHYQGNCCEWCDDHIAGRAIGNYPPEGCEDWNCNDCPRVGGIVIEKEKLKEAYIKIKSLLKKLQK